MLTMRNSYLILGIKSETHIINSLNLQHYHFKRSNRI